MASILNVSYVLRCPTIVDNKYAAINTLGLCRFKSRNCRKYLFPADCRISERPRHHSAIICSAANKPSPSTEISSTARIRSEVLSPFRSVRMFLYLAFIASATLGGLIGATQLISALTKESSTAQVLEIVKGLGIDIGAVSVFAFLYYRENKANNVQLSRISREENLSNLKLRVDEKKVISVSALRGIARLVVLAGPASFIVESFKSSEPFTESLFDRGVLVVPFAMDGRFPSFEFEESEEMKEVTHKRKRLWQLAPVYVSEWSKWLDEQKNLANVSPESAVSCSWQWNWLPSLACFCCTAATSKGNVGWPS